MMIGMQCANGNLHMTRGHENVHCLMLEAGSEGQSLTMVKVSMPSKIGERLSQVGGWQRQARGCSRASIDNGEGVDAR